MSESYQIVPPPGSPAPLDPKRIADLLAKDGQLILPLLDFLENARCALDDLVDVMGRATIEALLRTSAETIAGPKQQDKKSAQKQESKPRHSSPHGSFVKSRLRPGTGFLSGTRPSESSVETSWSVPRFRDWL